MESMFLDILHFFR